MLGVFIPLYSIFNYGICSLDYKIKSSTRINDRITDFFRSLFAPFSLQLTTARPLFTFESATIRNELPQKISSHVLIRLRCISVQMNEIIILSMMIVHKIVSTLFVPAASPTFICIFMPFIL